jgi:hypothetical protein
MKYLVGFMLLVLIQLLIMAVFKFIDEERYKK